MAIKPQFGGRSAAGVRAMLGESGHLGGVFARELFSSSAGHMRPPWLPNRLRPVKR